MIRTVIWFIWFWISLVISIPFMIRVKYLIKKDRIEESNALIHKYTSFWAKSLLKIAGAKVDVKGLENIPKDKTVLFIGNHQGNFDIPIYLSQMPVLIGFVAKIELEKLPLIKTWMTHMKCVFMDRSSLRKSSEAIIHGIKNLKAGYNMVIFPEGTRSRGDKPGEFKAGSFKLATKSKAAIIPVTMNGSYKIMEHGNGPWIRPANIELIIHPIIETSSLTKEELDALPSKVEEIICSKLPK